MLFRQLKRNAQCVTCSLGGDQLGYLGLILSPEAYEKIPQSEEFVRTTNPGPFQLVVDSTNPVPLKRTRARHFLSAIPSSNHNSIIQIQYKTWERKSVLPLPMICAVT